MPPAVKRYRGTAFGCRPPSLGLALRKSL